MQASIGAGKASQLSESEPSMLNRICFESLTRFDRFESIVWRGVRRVVVPVEKVFMFLVFMNLMPASTFVMPLEGGPGVLPNKTTGRTE